MTDHYITYKRINIESGIYRINDYMATHVPCGPRGKRGGAVAPSTLLRVRRVDAEFSRPSARWLAEVVIPGEHVRVIAGRVAATRDAAVMAAVKCAAVAVAA